MYDPFLMSHLYLPFCQLLHNALQVTSLSLPARWNFRAQTLFVASLLLTIMHWSTASLPPLLFAFIVLGQSVTPTVAVPAVQIAASSPRDQKENAPNPDPTLLPRLAM